MGRRGQGQGVSCTRIPGHSRATTQPRQPVSASCTHYNALAVLVPRVPALCSQGDPSHREIQATGKSRSWGNPSHWDQGCICLPTATPSQAAMGHFQHRQKKITGHREELQPAVTKAMPKALSRLPPHLCQCGHCPSAVLHLTISSVGCMPSQTDDGQILPVVVVTLQGKH